MKKLLIFVFVLVFALSACAPTDAPPAPVSDSDQSFASYVADEEGERQVAVIPVDDTVYTIRGTVVADTQSITGVRAEGSSSGSIYGGYGYASGSYSLWQEGKGFVRLKVTYIDPSLQNDVHDALFVVGDTVILKTTDKKAIVLLPGDGVTFKCRAQYENVGAVRKYETFDPDVLETWELDLCRLVTPKITPGDQ